MLLERTSFPDLSNDTFARLWIRNEQQIGRAWILQIWKELFNFASSRARGTWIDSIGHTSPMERFDSNEYKKTARRKWLPEINPYFRFDKRRCHNSQEIVKIKYVQNKYQMFGIARSEDIYWTFAHTHGCLVEMVRQTHIHALRLANRIFPIYPSPVIIDAEQSPSPSPLRLAVIWSCGISPNAALYLINLFSLHTVTHRIMTISITSCDAFKCECDLNAYCWCCECA